MHCHLLTLHNTNLLRFSRLLTYGGQMGKGEERGLLRCVKKANEAHVADNNFLRATCRYL